MNRIYKIVWSKTRNVYVVTSEIVRSHVKGTSGKMAVAVAVGFGVFGGGTRRMQRTPPLEPVAA